MDKQSDRYSATERAIARRYRHELLGGIGLYIALLVPSVVFAPAMPPGILKTLVVVSPMLGFLCMIWAIARHVARMDEYQRSVLLQTIAIASAATAGITFTYGFLENAGFPRLSMFAVWGVMGMCWLVAGALRCWVIKR